MAARWGAVVVLTFALLGAAAGLWMGGSTRLQVAQTNGSSGSADGSSGSSGDGSSGSSGDGTSGDGSSGSSGSGTGTGTAPVTTAPSRPGTPRSTIPRTTTTRPIPQPTTTSSIPPSRVKDGTPTRCRSDQPTGLVCFIFGGGGDVDAVRVPDGAGGTVVLPVDREPLFGDSGSSNSVTNNVTNTDVDVEVTVEQSTGEVVQVERQVNKTTQAVLGTLAALLLVMVASATGALGVRRYWR